MFQKSMTQVLLLAFFSLLSTFIPWAGADDKDPKTINIALVNGTPITQAQLDAEIGRFQQQITMTGQKMDPEQTTQMKQKVLDNLVDRELLNQQTKKLNVKVEDSEVNDRIATLKKRFPSEEEFTSTLGKMNLTEADLKAQFTQDMAIKKMIDQEVTAKIQISPEEVKQFYDSHPDVFKVPERVRASHILIKVDPKATPEEKAKARQKIEDIQKRLKKGEDFAALAKEVSECPSSANGGDLDFFEKGQMVPPFEAAAFALKPGEVSDIVETEFGYHIIKLTDKKEAGTMSFDEVKGDIEQHLKQQKVKEQLTQYVAQLKSKAKIEMVENKQK